MSSRRNITLISLLGLALLALLVYQRWQQGQTIEEGLIQANGRIEGTPVTIASKYPGRVLQLPFKEGDTIQTGQVVAKISDEEVQAKLRQAEAALAALRARKQAGESGVELLAQSVPIRVEVAEAMVNQAKAMAAKTRAAEEQARTDAERFKALAERGTIEQRRAEEAQLRWMLAKSDLAAAQTSVSAALSQVIQARLGTQEVTTKKEEILALEAQIKQAQAACDEIQCVIDNLEIRSPATGVVTEKLVQNGEIVAPGSPLLEIVNMDELYLKVYVAENYLGKLRRGLPARIHIDAYPDRYFTATVSYISSQAEFTPKEVQTPQERVKLVYAVKLLLDGNPEYLLTPGMPADAVIRWETGVEWDKPRW